MRTWEYATSQEARDFVEELTEGAADIVRSLRVEAGTTVHDASQFLLLTIQEAIDRLEQARSEVMSASLRAGVSATQMREWTRIPPAVAEQEIADYEETMRGVVDNE